MRSRFCDCVLAPADMRRAEQAAFDGGMPGILLMEHAALCVVNEMEKTLGSCAGKRALFVCGAGNNGGDGLAAARLFVGRGGISRVLMSGEPKTPEAGINFRLANALGIPVMAEVRAGAEENFDIIVDAVFGIGLRGAPEGAARDLILRINEYGSGGGGRPVVAVDIPSGIDGDTGRAPGVFVRADQTVTFHAAKPGHFFADGFDAAGELVIADIGLDGWLADGDKASLFTPDVPIRRVAPGFLAGLERFCRPALHKGDRGRVLIYAGSMGMAGAAAMCAKAAVVAGAGLTTVACPREIIPILQTLAPNAMCVDIMDAVKNPPPYDVLALGCGLGQSAEISRNILALINPDKPSVWDADALNLLAAHPDMAVNLPRAGMLVTPHPGEAARLLGWQINAVADDPIAAAEAIMRKFGCSVLLKGRVTVCASAYGADGRAAFRLMAEGTSALSKGGSGDALTGIIAALCAQSRTREIAEAAALGSLWHALAGRVGEEKYGRRELTTGQLIDCLNEAHLRALAGKW